MVRQTVAVLVLHMFLAPVISLDTQQLHRQQELLLQQLIPPLEQVEQMLICLLTMLSVT
jgi:ABC-type uncharacterized transport system permease subunit